MSGTPPGWYPDAQGTKRWFDGTSWTEHTQDATPTGPPSAPPSAPPPSAPPQAATPWGATAYQQPYGQQPYGQSSYGEPTPTGPRRRTGLIAGLCALGVLLVVGAVIGAVLLVRGSDDTEKASSDTTTTSSESRPSASSGIVSPGSPTPDPVEPSTEVSSEPVDPDPAGSSDPEAVADGFMGAIFSGDCAAAESFVSDQLIETEGTCAGSEIPAGTFDGLTYEIGKADVTGDTATVPVTLVVDLGDDSGLGDIPGTDLTLSLTRQGSRWLVTNLA